jgi:DNA-binding NtrC family response regulator
MPGSILVLDGPGRQLTELHEALATSLGRTAEVISLASCDALCARLSSDAPTDLVFVPFPEGDAYATGAEVVRRIRSCDAEIPVVAVAGHGDVRLASEAIAAGATDLLVIGDRLHDRVSTLLQKLRQISSVVERNRTLDAQNRRLRQAVAERYRLIGESPQILQVFDTIAAVALIPRPVLIVGERGTGKELVARAIHSASARPDHAFVAVNCAAFPETLLESELFGHERGAFTGAERMVPGKFEQADRGTLFLDEIAHMPLPFQQKILRVVEYGTFTRVGGTRELRTTARVLAATNADLEHAMRERRFLPDLYDRLAFEVVRVPPLRERDGDIRRLAEYFLRQFLREVPALGAKRFAEAGLEALERHPFPGNVRELKTAVERAAYRDTTSEITPEDLALPEDDERVAERGFNEQVKALQRRLLSEALRATNGNQAEAARRLGLAYHRFRYFARKLLPDGVTS